MTSTAKTYTSPGSNKGIVPGVSTDSIEIRTVLDCRSRARKYLEQCALLAASWHLNCRFSFTLEISHIGDLPASYRDFFAELGIELRAVTPIGLDAFSKTSNTLQALKGNRRTLLVDNDVWFARNPVGLRRIPANAIAGCVPGWSRVTEQQWQEIERVLDMTLIPANFIPPQESKLTLKHSEREPNVVKRIYVNGGVLLIPRPEQFRTHWLSDISSIAEHFENNPLCTTAVYGSNMAGLSSAISRHGEFEWLPIGYNFRPFSFAMGMADIDDIFMVHMVGNIEENGRNITDRLQSYWHTRVERCILELEGVILPAQLFKNLQIAEQCKHNLIQIAQTYELDSLVRD